MSSKKRQVSEPPNAYEQALNDAEAVRHLIKDNRGWSIVRKILEENIADLSSIKGIDTIVELRARQVSLKVLMKFSRQLQAIVDGLNETKAKDVNIADNIYKVIDPEDI